MELLSLTPERKTQLDEYARQCGKDASVVLDEALASFLDSAGRDFDEAVRGIGRGYADVKAGRTSPAEEVFDRLSRKYDLPD